MAISRSTLRLAVRNIARHGDTDVFPFPLENHWFFDAEDSVLDLLEKLDCDFASWLDEYPPTHVKALCLVGYSGFRAATQIEAIWNAYLLGLVLAVGEELEAVRIPTTDETVFSYRYQPEQVRTTLFDGELSATMHAAETGPG